MSKPNTVGRLHAMRLSDGSFEYIKNGTKTCEIRLNDEKRASLLVGDRIEFSRRPLFDDKVRVTVVALRQFASFVEMTQALDMRIYASGQQTPEEYIQHCYTFYTPSEEKKHGVLAIKFKLEK